MSEKRNDAYEIAESREKAAEKLSEDAIHHEVVASVCKMSDVKADMKVEILLQSIKDLAVVFNIIREFNQRGELSNKDYAEILEVMTSKFYDEGGEVEFDPRRYSNYEYA